MASTQHGDTNFISNDVGNQKGYFSHVVSDTELESDTHRHADLTRLKEDLVIQNELDISADRSDSAEDLKENRNCVNETDDDKLYSERHLDSKPPDHNLIYNEPKDGIVGLPDLIPAVFISSNSSQTSTHKMDALFDDIAPPLPESDPPSLASSFDFGMEHVNFEELINRTKGDDEDEDTENSSDTDSSTDDDSGSDTSSDDSETEEGAIVEDETMVTEKSNVAEGNVEIVDKNNTNTSSTCVGSSYTHMEQVDDLEAEFDFILMSLDEESQNTYLQKFDGRRDRSGILSPIVESPSPTPSSLSSCSGLSCASPDPLGTFRMSPGPGKVRQELDLSCLRVKSPDWDVKNIQPVPIYHARRILVVPDGYGWDSCEELVSPTGSGDWLSDDNGLCTPPVPEHFINFAQFGKHLIGDWKTPDIVIQEETEESNSSKSDTTLDDSDDSDSDDTVEGEYVLLEPGAVGDLNNTHSVEIDDAMDIKETHAHKSARDNERDNGTQLRERSVEGDLETDTNTNINVDYDDVMCQFNQTIELFELEEEILKVEDELNDFKLKRTLSQSTDQIVTEQTINSFTPALQCNDIDTDMDHGLFVQDTQDYKPDLIDHEEETINVRSLESSLNDSYKGFREALAMNNTNNVDRENQTGNHDGRTTPIVRLDSKQTTSDGNSDAEDEYSDSGSERENNNGSPLFIAPKSSSLKFEQNQDCLSDSDGIEVSEVLTPSVDQLPSEPFKNTGVTISSASLSSSSTDSSDEETDSKNDDTLIIRARNPDISVRQCTSGDSDETVNEVNESELFKGMPTSDESEGTENESVDPELGTEMSRPNVEERDEKDIDIPVREQTIPTILITSHTQDTTDAFLPVHDLVDGINESEIPPEQHTFKCDDKLSDISVELVTDLNAVISLQEKNIVIAPAGLNEAADILENGKTSPETVPEYEFDTESFVYRLPDKAINDRSVNYQVNERGNGEKGNCTRNFQNGNSNKRHLQYGTDKTIETNAKEHGLIQKSSVEHDIRSPDTKPMNHVKKVTRRASTDKAPAVKIKVGHLEEKNSFRSKVKRGFVQGLLEIFDPTAQHPNREIVRNKPKLMEKTNPYAVGVKPTILKPNENIVIDKNHELRGSLGFDVHSLNYTEPDDKTISGTLDFTGTPGNRENTHSVSEDFANVGNGDATCFDGDTTLKLYENHLRELDNTDESLNCDHDVATQSYYRHETPIHCSENPKLSSTKHEKYPLTQLAISIPLATKKRTALVRGAVSKDHKPVLDKTEPNEATCKVKHSVNKAVTDRKHEFKRIKPTITNDSILKRNESDNSIHHTRGEPEKLSADRNDIGESTGKSDHSNSFSKSPIMNEPHNWMERPKTHTPETACVVKVPSHRQPAVKKDTRTNESLDTIQRSKGDTETNDAVFSQMYMSNPTQSPIVNKTLPIVDNLDESVDRDVYFPRDFERNAIDIEIGGIQSPVPNKDMKEVASITLEHSNSGGQNTQLQMENRTHSKPMHQANTNDESACVKINHEQTMVPELHQESSSQPRYSHFVNRPRYSYTKPKIAAETPWNNAASTLPPATFSETRNPWFKPEKRRGLHRSKSAGYENVGKPTGRLYDIIARIQERFRQQAEHEEIEIADPAVKAKTIGPVYEREQRPIRPASAISTRDRTMGNASFNTSPVSDVLKPFEIKYPDSLKQELVGPYCRTHGFIKRPEFEFEDFGETTVDGKEKRVDLSYPFMIKSDSHDCERLSDNFNSRPNKSESRTNIPFHRTRSLSLDRDETYDNGLSNTLHTSPNLQNDTSEVDWTHYNVKSPLSHASQREGIKYRVKPITYSEANQAERENNFINVKACSAVEPIPLCNDAQTGKQEYHFCEKSHYSNGLVISNRSPDSNENNGNSKSTCISISDSDRSELCNGSNVDLTEGELQDKRSVKMKNEFCHKKLGVQYPATIASNEVSYQSTAMNNVQLSTDGKGANGDILLHGINDIARQEGTKNINSPHSSPGNAITSNTSNGQAVKDGGKSPTGENTHSNISVVIQRPGYQHVLEDANGKLKVWPYSEIDNIDKLPVTLHRAKKGLNLLVCKGMSDSKMTVIHSAEHSSQMAENKMVNRYHSSSVLPGEDSGENIMKVHGDSMQSMLLQDSNGNALSEEELAAVLPKIADTISKLDNKEAEEILPGITQSITKLKNGGNLVITTMTRHLDEEESVSSGRGSPETAPSEGPMLNVDDLENSKLYLVRDSQGELFYVEDITEESQESAYFSSSRGSESECSPTFDRLSSGLLSAGTNGIQGSTANEILSAMYGADGVQEINENEEEWSERTYEYDRTVPRRDSFKPQYMVEEPETLSRMNAANYAQAQYPMANMPMVFDGGLAQSYSQMTTGAEDNLSMMSAQNASSGAAKTIERYTIEGEVFEYPIVPLPPPPQPELYIPPPPLFIPAPLPPVRVTVPPTTRDESTMIQEEPKEEVEHVIYKTVAHIHPKEKLPAPKPEVKQEKKAYKVVSSRAAQVEEQESHMRLEAQESQTHLEDVNIQYHSENVYKAEPRVAETQYFVRNTTHVEPPTRFRSEKKVELAKQADQTYKSEIQVKDTRQEKVEESSYSYDEMRSHMSQSGSDMRVVRGSYLIKNSLDDAGGYLDDNINMFDGKFELCKDNPLYKSEEDLYSKKSERSATNRKQEQRRKSQDLEYKTVDKYSKTKNGV